MANTYSYPHVEDYIEIISGYRKPDGSRNTSYWLSPEPLISLARYDVKIVESLGSQTFVNGNGYTDKQAQLAYTIAVKYERQLYKHNIEITPIKETAAYRIPIRVIDRTTRAWVDNDVIKLRFPYNTELIEQIRTESRTSKGTIKFDREERVWCADLTENNVNWAYMFAQAQQFEIDPTLQRFMDLLIAAEKTPYKIELRADPERLYIENAADSLVEYVESNIGGFSEDNLLQLVDNAPICGYTVDPVIGEVIEQAYSRNFLTLCTNREVKSEDAAYDTNVISEIIRYARVTNRLPIYLYEPDHTDRLLAAFMLQFAEDQISLTDKSAITEKTQLVFRRKLPKIIPDRVPLLVSGAGMMYGPDKQTWINQAEKVVYFTKDIYNKNAKQGKEICKLD